MSLSRSDRFSADMHKRTWFTVIVVTVLLLILARVGAPYAVQYYINQQINQTKGITGQVGDVDLQLYRGAYAVDDIEIYAVDEQSSPKPLLSVKTLDFSLAWSAVLNGNLVTNMVFSQPKVVVYDKDTTTPEQNQQVKDERTWIGLANNLVVFSIDTLKIIDGKISLVNQTKKGEIPTYIANINADIKNITNAQNLTKTLVTSVDVKGDLMGEATLTLVGKLDPFSEQANFDFNMEVQRFSVKQIQTVFNVYTPFDIEAGGIDGAMELAAKSNEVNGYAKAGVYDLSIFSWREDAEKDDDGLFTIIFEGGADLLSAILENDESQLVAARIPIEGTLDSTDISTFQAVVSVLKNAFFDATKMQVDDIVSYESVTTSSSEEEQ
ncbi:DUF748 domain-containing protein [Alteromonas sp.]|uniref:DUF748 domain-containing protein n=1 Tax=Alteromonas sp. TaxID=232 RepID=UPI000B6FD527|nr:DUF748 domain-containing protein [Alteromonas sp.]OUX86067.1 MAG: hypothetical protein CBB95_12070 [Alteromonas sp. TMED35]